MANHISHAALPYPIKGCRFTILVPYLDADGDPTDPTTPDTERSIDAAAFADCTEEVSTITGSNGMGYITLTGDEMNGSAIAVCAKVASGPKATLATLYPRVLPVLTSGTASAGAAGTITLASGAAAIDDIYNGCIIRTTGGTGGAGGSGSLGNQARVITDYVGSTKVATISPSWETTPSSDTTYEVLQAETALFTFANAIQWNGTAVATPATAGVPDVNIKNVNNVSASSVTAVNANQGTTQPVNFTGTGASALAKSDMVDVAGAAVSTSTAQIGVNAVNIGGTAQTGRDIGASVIAASVSSGGITAASFAANALDAVWSTATRLLTAGTNIVLAKGTGVTGFNDLSAAQVNAEADTALADVGVTTTVTGRIDAAISTRLATAGYTAPPSAATIAAAVWDYLTSAATTVGSLGKLLVDNIDAAISTRLATSGYTAPLSAAGIRTAVGLASANLDTQLSTIDDFLDTEIAAIQAKTDLIPASPAAVGSAMTLASGSITAAVVATGAIDADALATDAVNEIADGLLNRDMSTGTDSGSTTVRTMRQALRFLRNKWSVSGATLTVTKEDDSSTSWTSTLTSSASADPVTGSDPA